MVKLIFNLISKLIVNLIYLVKLLVYWQNSIKKHKSDAETVYIGICI